MFKKILIATASLTAGLFLCVLIFKDDKKAAVIAMTKYGVKEGQYYGHYDEISPLWKHYKVFEKELAEKELVELCEHENPVVRCYAFQALKNRCSLGTYEVLLKHLSDTTTFTLSSGCFVNDTYVVDYFLDLVSYDKDWPTTFQLTDNEYRYIDSVLLFGDAVKMTAGFGYLKYRSRKYMLERIEPAPVFYDRIKELATSGVYDALPALARFQKDQDTTLFIEMLLSDKIVTDRLIERNARASVLNFPHPSFYPVLKKQLLSEIESAATSGSDLYLALAQYPTKETRELFELVVAKADSNNRVPSRYVSWALEHYPSAIFDGVIKDKEN